MPPKGVSNAIDKDLQAVRPLPVHSVEKCENGHSPAVPEVPSCRGKATDTEHGRDTPAKHSSQEILKRIIARLKNRLEPNCGGDPGYEGFNRGLHYAIKHVRKEFRG